VSVDLGKPVIWTTKGNVNECDLDQFDGNSFKLTWQIVTDPVQTDVLDHVVCVKEFYLQGELVKREPHVLKLRGIESLAQQPSP
jgi:hypothetical protein